MKIAITYDNGQVFQHFGKTEAFMVYEIEDGNLVNSEILPSNGAGHGALAGLLAEQAVDVLICGKISDDAMSALADCGIEVCAGTQGDTEDVLETYMNGELVSAGGSAVGNCVGKYE